MESSLLGCRELSTPISGAGVSILEIWGLEDPPGSRCRVVGRACPQESRHQHRGAESAGLPPPCLQLAVIPAVLEAEVWWR